MQTINLLDFFQQVGYDYKKDEEKISKICYYTKTRVDNTIKEYKLTRGCEQPFLIKALVEWYGVKKFFEIGTGRGTASYSISLCPDIKEIATVDIIPFTQTQSTAIGHKKAVVSQKDIFKLIPYKEKEKIKFGLRKQFFKNISMYHKCFDMCFIDGEHSIEQVILNDFDICNDIVKDDGIFIFDDYGPEKFVVKKVVDKILNEHKDLQSLLIEFHGHLFGGEKDNNEGLVTIKRGNIL